MVLMSGGLSHRRCAFPHLVMNLRGNLPTPSAWKKGHPFEVSLYFWTFYDLR
jgi:hypothetical protein